MTRSPRVLLVAPTPSVAAKVSAELVEAGLRVTLVTHFKAARQGLESSPDLLISEVRLGEYNGLHLALRAQGRGIRAIMLGALDRITQREAETLGADFLADDCDSEKLTDAVRAAGLETRTRFGRR